jgi:hypothetical protein
VSWLRLDDGFDTHPKVLQLTELQRWRWTRLLLYCARYETEGVVTRDVMRELGLSRAADKLLHLNLLLASTSGPDIFVVNDWAIYNPGRRDDEAVENAVRAALVEHEAASANEIAGIVGGNRKAVLGLIRRFRAGSLNGSLVVPGTTEGTGSQVVPELVSRAGTGARPVPVPQELPEDSNVAVDDARAEPVDNQFVPPPSNGANGNGTATGFTQVEDLEGQP